MSRAFGALLTVLGVVALSGAFIPLGGDAPSTPRTGRTIGSLMFGSFLLYAGYDIRRKADQAEKPGEKPQAKK